MPDRLLPPRRVVVLICCYNARGHLDDCLGSLRQADNGPLDVKVVLVDNASTDNSGEYIREHFEWVDVIRCEPNRGFAGGNNYGWDYVRRELPDTDYVVLLNADTQVQPGWLLPLVRFLEEHGEAGAVQPKLLLHGRPGVINTVGNRIHYLGFGMMTGYGEEDRGQYGTPRRIDFPSGAAAMIRASLLGQFGLFDEQFFMTLEDADLGLKLRQAGHEIWYVPDSVVLHKYLPDTPVKLYEYLERNRWLLLLSYYRASSLLVLAPALGVMELAQIGFALNRGLLRRYWHSRKWFTLASNRRHLWSRRRPAQQRRRVSDATLLAHCATEIRLPDEPPGKWLFVANQLFSAYWRFARLFVSGAMNRCDGKKI